MEFVRQILMKLKMSSNASLLMKVFSHSLMWLSKHCSGHYVTTQACTLISWGCVHLRWCGSLEDYTQWRACIALRMLYICNLHGYATPAFTLQAWASAVNTSFIRPLSMLSNTHSTTISLDLYTYCTQVQVIQEIWEWISSILHATFTYHIWLRA